MDTTCRLGSPSVLPIQPQKAFYFIRHGETGVNADPHTKEKDCDLPLNQRGIDQAKMAGRIIATLPIRSIRSSPLQRATQTRDLILQAVDLPYQEDECLGECQAATWRTMTQLKKGGDQNVCPTVQTFLLRTVKGVTRALEERGPILIVAHGGIHWALCYLFGIENHPWAIGNCEVVHFRPMSETCWEASIIA